MENFNTGGSVSLAALHQRQAATKALLESLYGEVLAKKVHTDRKYLNLLLHVLDSDGKDLEAVENLRTMLEKDLVYY
jgi:hypothetical protein